MTPTLSSWYRLRLVTLALAARHNGTPDAPQEMTWEELEREATVRHETIMETPVIRKKKHNEI